MDLQAKTLLTQSGRLHYWTHAAGDGPWIVFLHGACCDHRMFKAQLRGLPPGWRVCLWDAPGHGASRPLKSPFSFAGMLADLEALLLAEDISEAVFVGQSMGGLLLQRFGQKHPEKVRGMILIDINRLTDPLTALEKKGAVLTPTLLHMRPWPVLIEETAFLCGAEKHTRRYVRNTMKRMNKEEVVAIMAALLGALAPGAPQPVFCPTLLIVGEKDRLGVVKKSMTRWAMEDSNCHLAVIKGAAHNANQDRPQVVNRLMHTFLDGLASSQGAAGPNT